MRMGPGAAHTLPPARAAPAAGVGTTMVALLSGVLMCGAGMRRWPSSMPVVQPANHRRGEKL